jgi:hypothetical protein
MQLRAQQAGKQEELTPDITKAIANTGNISATKGCDFNWSKQEHGMEFNRKS